jgi:hypothetical protein
MESWCDALFHAPLHLQAAWDSAAESRLAFYFGLIVGEIRHSAHTKKAAVVIAGEAVFAIAALALWRKRKFVSIGILLFVLVDIIVSTFGY